MPLKWSGYLQRYSLITKQFPFSCLGSYLFSPETKVNWVSGSPQTKIFYFKDVTCHIYEKKCMSLPFTQCYGTCHSALFRTKMPFRVSCIRRNENKVQHTVLWLGSQPQDTCPPNVTNKTVLRAVGNDKQNHRALLFIVLFQAHLKASLERNRDESQSHCSQKELSLSGTQRVLHSQV